MTTTAVHRGTSVHQWQRDDYTVSTDRDRLDVDVIHQFLTHSYWVAGIPRDLVARSIDHSLCFGLYKATEQIGFARVVTDYTHSAHIMDVFVLPPHRGQGLAVWLIECLLACPPLQGLRSMTLSTADAHELYRRFGFTEVDNPENRMIRSQEMDWFRADMVRP